MSANERDVQGLVDEVVKGRISRRQFLERGLALGLSVSALGTVLAACGTGGSQASGAAESPSAINTTKPSSITLYNWADYMTEDLKKKFQQETGIKVNETNFSSNEDLFAKLRAGATGYDVCVPSDFMVTTLIKSNLLRPLDMSLIPNFKYADKQFQNATYDNPSLPANKGNKYSVPYQWGVTAYAHRVDTIPAPATGWADLWNPKYKGQIDMLDSERDTMGAALKLLGYSLNTTNEAEINAAADKLIQQKPLVSVYDSVNIKRAMVQGVGFVMTYSGYYMIGVMAMGGNQKALETAPYVLPKEGYPLWADNLAIPAASTKAYGAHLFLDFMLKPENQGALANFAYTWPVTREAEPFTNKLVFSVIPSEQDLQRAERIADVGQATRIYDTAWQNVKAA